MATVDLAPNHPTVHHNPNGFSTTFIVLPLYSLVLTVNTVMLTVIALVTIFTIELFVLTLIIR